MARSSEESEARIQGRHALCVGEPQRPPPSRWQWVRLLDIARLETGHTPSRNVAAYWNGPIPWVTIPDARLHHGKVVRETRQTITQAGIDNSAARVLPANTVCLSRTASVGYVTTLGVPAATSQDFVCWICSDAIDPAFLQWLLLAEGDDIRRFGKGTTHTTIYFPEVRAFHVCIPPLAEQRRIVAKLEALLGRIRRAREALDAVPAMVDRAIRATLDDAIHGTLTKGWRAERADVALHSTRRDELILNAQRGGRRISTQPDPKALRELPQSWSWTTVDTAGELHLGRQRAPQYQTGKFTKPYLRVANIKEDRIDFRDVASMDFNEADFAHYQLRRGDVLLSEGQSPELVGQSAIYQGDVEGLCFQKTLHRFRAFAGGVSPEFAQLVFRAYLRTGTFRSVASLTVNIAHLTLVRLKPLHFPLPPQDEEREIVRVATTRLRRIDQLRAAAESARAQLDTLERSLLAKAFRGELVEQDPADEPASVMLDRVRAERAKADAPAKKPRKPRGESATSTPTEEPARVAPPPTAARRPKPVPDSLAAARAGRAATGTHAVLSAYAKPSHRKR
jgi:type I restriction enzyme S subunit